jgi:hypothetical protein
MALLDGVPPLHRRSTAPHADGGVPIIGRLTPSYLLLKEDDISMDASSLSLAACCELPCLALGCLLGCLVADGDIHLTDGEGGVLLGQQDSHVAAKDAAGQVAVDGHAVAAGDAIGRDGAAQLELQETEVCVCVCVHACLCACVHCWMCLQRHI